MKNINPTQTAAWQALQKHFDEMKDVTIADLFAKDADRFSKFSATFDDLMLVDFSKNRITEETLAKLQDLAKETELADAIKSMFSGEKINRTEDRAVLHVALRNRSNTPIIVDGKDVMPEVNAVLEKMKTFSEAIISGQWKGYTGKAITDVVNIGIGGSDLGPFMVTEALRPYKNHLNMHFVSNVDGTHIAEVLKKVNPETTLFLVASKTFTTQETMTNAHSARDWFLKTAGDEKHVAKHFAALSTNGKAVGEFGIDTANMFEFWDWVGGRYSLWSAIGLPIAIAIGAQGFRDFLAGAHAMDEHFRTAPLAQNLPVRLGLLDVWYRNFHGFTSRCITPYHAALGRYPAYLQQLEMESNGKRVAKDGSLLTCVTSPVLWGEPGTNGQHAFFQMLHQGTDVLPLEIVAVRKASHPLPGHQQKLLANALAQTQALMMGKASDDGHRHFPGNRPSTLMLLESLTPTSLGALIALQEHRVFVSGSLWGINSFDQWGVELGKVLAKDLEARLESGDVAGLDGSTAGLLGLLRNVA